MKLMVGCLVIFYSYLVYLHFVDFLTVGQDNH